MLIGSRHILGPVSARSLDPLILAQSQPPEMRGYVVVAQRQEADPPKVGGERNWSAIILTGNAQPECMLITESTKNVLSFSRFKHERQNEGRADREVYLFEAPERLLREFVSIAHADPVMKVALDSLDLRQVETLLASSPVRQGLLERSDFGGDFPRFELARISTLIEGLGIPLSLPQLQLGYEKGGLALYRLDPAVDRPASGAPEGRAPQGKRPPARRPATHAEHSRRPSAGSAPNTQPGDAVVGLFQRLFRSFRKKAVDCLGARWEDALRSGVEKVRFLSPDFQPDLLLPATAPQVLDLILELVAAAPFLKRSRLRESALLLIADIYDRHYDLLEARGLVDRVEQTYLRLKK